MGCKAINLTEKDIYLIALSSCRKRFSRAIGGRSEKSIVYSDGSASGKVNYQDCEDAAMEAIADLFEVLKGKDLNEIQEDDIAKMAATIFDNTIFDKVREKRAITRGGGWVEILHLNGEGNVDRILNKENNEVESTTMVEGNKVDYSLGSRRFIKLVDEICEDLNMKGLRKVMLSMAGLEDLTVEDRRTVYIKKAKDAAEIIFKYHESLAEVAVEISNEESEESNQGMGFHLERSREILSKVDRGSARRTPNEFKKLPNPLFMVKNNVSGRSLSIYQIPDFVSYFKVSSGNIDMDKKELISLHKSGGSKNNSGQFNLKQAA